MDLSIPVCNGFDISSKVPISDWSVAEHDSRSNRVMVALCSHGII